jgi:hypothetical protein
VVSSAGGANKIRSPQFSSDKLTQENPHEQGSATDYGSFSETDEKGANASERVGLLAM